MEGTKVSMNEFLATSMVENLKLKIADLSGELAEAEVKVQMLAKSSIQKENNIKELTEKIQELELKLEEKEEKEAVSE
jgi:predicted RNase H-like nuclease (RuvC/YqgF family)